MDVQSAANTCTYDGTLAVPSSAPTRTGYTFAGWTVRPEMNFSTIPTNVNGTNRWAIGWYNTYDECCHGFGVEIVSAVTAGELPDAGGVTVVGDTVVTVVPAGTIVAVSAGSGSGSKSEAMNEPLEGVTR